MKFHPNKLKQAYARYSQLKTAIFWPLSSLSGWKNCQQKELVMSTLVRLKKREIQNSVFNLTWRRNYGSLCGHKPGKNKQYVFESCKLWL